MHNTTPSRCPFLSSKSAIIALAIAAALTSLAPGRASADAPTVIRGASTAVLAIRASIGVRVAAVPTVLENAPEPAKGGFISDDLLRRATEIINNGIRLGHGSRNGTFYVHAEPQGFGGVVTIRYRR